MLGQYLVSIGAMLLFIFGFNFQMLARSPENEDVSKQLAWLAGACISGACCLLVFYG